MGVGCANENAIGGNARLFRRQPFDFVAKRAGEHA